MKQTIKETAMKLFIEKGYQNVTVVDICEACHITKPTFYKYAGKKEDLVVDLYDDIIQEMLHDPLRFVDCDSHYEQLVMMFSCLITTSKQLGADLFSGMLISNLLENHHSFDMRSEMTTVAVKTIEKAQRNGEIQNPGLASSLYYALGHMYMGYETNWCINNGDYGYEKEFFHAMNDLFIVREDLKDIYKKYDSNIHTHKEK